MKLCILTWWMGQWDIPLSHTHTQKRGSPDLMQSQHTLRILWRTPSTVSTCRHLAVNDHTCLSKHSHGIASGVRRLCWTESYLTAQTWDSPQAATSELFKRKARFRRTKGAFGCLSSAAHKEARLLSSSHLKGSWLYSDSTASSPSL